MAKELSALAHHNALVHQLHADGMVAFKVFCALILRHLAPLSTVICLLSGQKRALAYASLFITENENKSLSVRNLSGLQREIVILQHHVMGDTGDVPDRLGFQTEV